jgi:hypothetical protein
MLNFIYGKSLKPPGENKAATCKMGAYNFYGPIVKSSGRIIPEMSGG